VSKRTINPRRAGKARNTSAQRRAIAERKTEAQARQEEMTGYKGNGMAALDISPAPALVHPPLAAAAGDGNKWRGKVAEDFATARALAEHLARAKTRAKPKRGNGKAGRPMGWRQRVNALTAVEVSLLTPKPAQPAGPGRYRKKFMPVHEQVAEALGRSAGAGKKAIRDTHAALKGWSIQRHKRGRRVPYPALKLRRYL